MIKAVLFLIATALFLIATALFLIASPAPAEASPIFPPLVSGQYSLAIVTAAVEPDEDGVPLRPPTASVGFRRADVAGAPLLVCVDLATPAFGERVSVLVTVPASGSRAELRGVAFAGLACEGPDSEWCDDGAFVFFVPPAKPGLELGP